MAYWWLDACAVPDAQAATVLQAGWSPASPGPVADDVRAALLQLAALQRTPHVALEHPWLCVFAGDHGVADALGVHAATGATLAALAGRDSVLRERVHASGGRLDLVNLGVRDDPGDLAGVRREVIAAATADFRVHPAMNAEKALRAIGAGAASMATAIEAGARIGAGVTLGDAGATAARALACRLLGLSPSALCGADDAPAAQESAVIAAGLARHVGAVDALACLRRLGGFEIAALVGACLAAAQRGVPMLVEGVVGAVAAMVAVGLNADCRPWIVLVDGAGEPGLARVANALHVEPFKVACATPTAGMPVLAAMAALRAALQP